MKNLFLIFILAASIVSAHAESHTFSFPTQGIEAFISKTGAYVSLRDIQDGFDALDGVVIGSDKATLFTNPAILDVFSIIFTNDIELEFSIFARAAGGDMGGG